MIYLLWEYSDLCDCNIIRGYVREEDLAREWVNESFSGRKFVRIEDITGDQ